MVPRVLGEWNTVQGPGAPPDDVPRCADLSRGRNLLGEEATGMSDDQVERMTRDADVMARAIIAAFLDKQSRSRAA